eukprot:3912213-Rhodomonas_salina.2
MAPVRHRLHSLRSHVPPPYCLRPPYAISGTDLGYAATRPTTRPPRIRTHQVTYPVTRPKKVTRTVRIWPRRSTLTCMTRTSTSLRPTRCLPIPLCTSYAMSGTDVAYRAVPVSEHAHCGTAPPLSAYALSSTDLAHAPLPAYARATRCPALT